MRISEAAHLRRANRSWRVGILTLAFVTSSSVGLYLFAADHYSEHRVRNLIRSAYDAQRPGGGRLFRAPYAPAAVDQHPPADLGQSQVYLLRHPEIADRQRLQGMIYLATGDWRRFADSHSRQPPETSETLNNLGVTYLAASDIDRTYLLKALEQFDRAADLDPTAPEPRFNRRAVRADRSSSS